MFIQQHSHQPRQTVSRTSIEVNTLIKPHMPSASEPAGDDDPTGVRALLSSLPEPEPMPKHLVERINASLAAEQAQRATLSSGASPRQLRATPRGRRARLVLAVAGAAATAAVIAVLGSNVLTTHQSNNSSSSAAIASTSGAEQTRAGVPPSAANKAPALVRGTTASPVQIGWSGTRYTQAGFVAQAEALRRSPLDALEAQPAKPSGVGPGGGAVRLKECLGAIGAAGAQVVRADVAFYQGHPAMIIVATTNGLPVAYAVGRQCSRTDPAILRPATPLR